MPTAARSALAHRSRRTVNEPTTTPPAPDAGAAPDPFEPGPAQLSGCGKPAVIGCLVLLAVVAVSLVLLVSQSRRVMVFLMEQMRGDITAALPPDLPADERQRLDAAFDAAIRAVEEGRFDSTSVNRLQQLTGLMPKRGEVLDRQRVEEIRLLFEAIGAVEAAAARRRSDAGRGRGLPLAAAIRPWACGARGAPGS